MKHNPLATEKPILRPVNEPGPLLIPKKSKSENDIFFSFINISTNTLTFSEWEGLSNFFSLTVINFEFSKIATEQFFEEVSIHKLRAINLRFLFLTVN